MFRFRCFRFCSNIDRTIIEVQWPKKNWLPTDVGTRDRAGLRRNRTVYVLQETLILFVLHQQTRPAENGAVCRHQRQHRRGNRKLTNRALSNSRDRENYWIESHLYILVVWVQSHRYWAWIVNIIRYFEFHATLLD